MISFANIDIRHRALRDGVSECVCPFALCHYPLSLVLGLGQGFGQGAFLKNLGLGGPGLTFSRPLGLHFLANFGFGLHYF